MTLTLKHKKVSARSNGADSSLVRPSDWNDNHDLESASNVVLGRASTGTGPVEELTGAQVRTIADTAQNGVLAGINTRTASYTLVAADRGKVIEMNVASANTVTIPNESGISGVNFPIGTQILVLQLGDGETTLLPAAGVTVRSLTGGLSTVNKYAAVSLYKRASNDWLVVDQSTAYLSSRLDALTNFADVYQGAKTADPSIRNNDAPLQTGDLYYNTVNNRMRVYEVGTGWIDYEATAQTAATTATAQASISTANASTSTTAANLATTSRIAAEAARDAALAAGDIYASTAAGLAVVPVGSYFSVPGGTSYDYLILYRVDAGPVATEVKRYPATPLIDKLVASVNSNSGTDALHVVADGDGNVLAHIKKNGGLHLLNDELSVQSHIATLETAVQNNAGTNAIVALADGDGKVVASINKNLELTVGANPRSLQAGVASNYVFRAMRYASESNATQAAYWYDRAENEFPGPVRLDKLIAAENTDSSIQRMPVITRVSSGRLLYMWHQIRKPVFSDGDGVRLLQCFVDYDLAAGTLTATAPVVFEEPTGWATNTGCNQSPHLITLPSGKIICVFCQQDAPSGLVANDDRNIYVKSSTDGGVTWSAKTKIVSAPGVAPRYALTGASGDFVRIPAGTYAGRIVFTIYESSGAVSAVYSDDEGVTWTKGSAVTATGFSVNESTISLRSDNSLIMNLRTEGSYQLVYATSTNGGSTWTFQGARTGWQSSNCASSMVQASSSPLDGYKKLLWSGLDNNVSFRRSGLVLRVSHDDGVTYQTQYRPIESGTPAGYSCARMIEPNVVAVAWENGFNSTCSSMLYIVNLSEVYANGTHS